MMSRKIIYVFLLLLSSLTSPGLYAEQNLLQSGGKSFFAHDTRSERQIAQQSEFIVRAFVSKVTAAREQYDEKVNLVMSRVKLRLIESWKGTLPQELEIRSFGGFLNGFPYFSEAFPRFQEGEEVVLFLKKFRGGVFPVGHAAGKRTVKNQVMAETGETVSDLRNKILTDYLK